MDWKPFEHEATGAELITKDESDECYYEFIPDFVKETGYLPIECRECYKALIFWPYSKINVSNFKRMLEALPVSIHGKYNESVVVFYFKSKGKMLSFLEVLKEKMSQFGVEGRIQWRVSGRYWQDAYPQFFNSAKELKPIRISKEITIKEWLNLKGLLH
jgi:hypothetical protein